jgi:hypothetical protein
VRHAAPWLLDLASKAGFPSRRFGDKHEQTIPSVGVQRRLIRFSLPIRGSGRPYSHFYVIWTPTDGAKTAVRCFCGFLVPLKLRRASSLWAEIPGTDIISERKLRSRCFDLWGPWCVLLGIRIRSVLLDHFIVDTQQQKWSSPLAHKQRGVIFTAGFKYCRCCHGR